MSSADAYYVAWLSGYRYCHPNPKELRRLQRKWKCAVSVTHHAPAKEKTRRTERYGLWRSMQGFYQTRQEAEVVLNRLSKGKTYSIFTLPLFDDGWLS